MFTFWLRAAGPCPASSDQAQKGIKKKNAPSLLLPVGLNVVCSGLPDNLRLGLATKIKESLENKFAVLPENVKRGRFAVSVTPLDIKGHALTLNLVGEFSNPIPGSVLNPETGYHDIVVTAILLPGQNLFDLANAMINQMVVWSNYPKIIPTTTTQHRASVFKFPRQEKILPFFIVK